MAKSKEYQDRVADTALRIIGNCRCDRADQLADLCPDENDKEALAFASDVYEFMLEELDRRSRPSIARNL